jgi:6-phosphogluconolactonase
MTMSSFAFIGSLTRPGPGAPRGRGITSARFDPLTGRLDPFAEIDGVDDPNWLTLDVEGRRLYAAAEDETAGQGVVVAYAIAEDGALREINRQPTGGQTVCHSSLSPDGRFLLAANYNADPAPGAPDAAAVVFPIGPDGGLLPASARVHHQGSGPNTERQARSHGHCVKVSPDGRFAYVTDLGSDRILCYALGAEGSLSPVPDSDKAATPGCGPRHIVFSADGRRLYLITELLATVVAYEVDTETGALTLADTLTIEAEGSEVIYPSGLLLSPDGRTLFGEVRRSEEIVALAIEPPTGRLRLSGRWPSGGRTPRDFCFSPDGRFLLVANQDEGNVTVFPVDGAVLKPPVETLAIGAPMAVVVGEF